MIHTSVITQRVIPPVGISPLASTDHPMWRIPPCWDLKWKARRRNIILGQAREPHVPHGKQRKETKMCRHIFTLRSETPVTDWGIAPKGGLSIVRTLEPQIAPMWLLKKDSSLSEGF